MYLNVVGDSRSIRSNDFELTMDYDMIVSLGKGWFQISRYVSLILGTHGPHVWEVAGKHAWYYLDKVIVDVFI